MLLVERVAVERVGVALVERVVLVLLVERCVASERVGVPAERVLVEPVERVAVALVGREDLTSVLPLTACERFTVLPVRADSPRVALVERDTAVFVLPKVRLLAFTVPRSPVTLRWPAALRLTPPAACVPRTLLVLRISRALTIPALRFVNERSG